MRQAMCAVLLPAVSLTGCTARPGDIISTAMLLQIGLHSAAPGVHIHAYDTRTPTMLTPQLDCDAEPPASGVASMMCALEMQPLGSGLHSIPLFVYSFNEDDHLELANATTLQTLTPDLRFGAEPQPHGVCGLMCEGVNGGEQLLCSGIRSPCSVLSSTTSTRTHDGSGTSIKIRRLWSAQSHAKPTSDWNCFVSSVSIKAVHDYRVLMSNEYEYGAYRVLILMSTVLIEYSYS